MIRKCPPSANKKDGEWNFKQDPAAAALVCASWPTPVLFNGEGGSTCSGRRVTCEMAEHNPLTMAYRHYPGVGFAGDRLSWDPISCLVTMRCAAPWYQVVRGGVNVTDATAGLNTWQAGEDRGHSYLQKVCRQPNARPDETTRSAREAVVTRASNSCSLWRPVRRA